MAFEETDTAGGAELEGTKAESTQPLYGGKVKFEEFIIRILFTWQERKGNGRGWEWGARGAMSNPSPMSQAMSHGDTKLKTLSRVEVSRA